MTTADLSRDAPSSPSVVSPTPLVSPVISSSSVVAQDTLRTTSEGTHPGPSPAHKKRQDSVVAQGGETYWLVPQSKSSKPPVETHNTGPSSPHSASMLPSVSSALGLSEIESVGPQETSSRESLSIKDSVADSSPSAIERLSSKADVLDGQPPSSVAQSTTVVINSDSLWGHQQPVKDNSSSISTKDQARPAVSVSR